MSQITGKWIANGAITPEKLSSSGEFIVESLDATSISVRNLTAVSPEEETVAIRVDGFVDATGSIRVLSDGFFGAAIQAISTGGTEVPALNATNMTGPAISAVSGSGMAIHAINDSATRPTLQLDNINGMALQADNSSYSPTVVINNNSMDGTALKVYAPVKNESGYDAIAAEFTGRVKVCDAEAPDYLYMDFQNVKFVNPSGGHIGSNSGQPDSTINIKADGNTLLAVTSMRILTGAEEHDGMALQADSSCITEPTVQVRNYGDTGVALRAWSEIGGTALEVYGKAELSGATHITDTLDVVQESSGTVVSFSNTYDNDFDPNVKTLVVDGLNGITLTSTAGLDGTAGYFYAGSNGIAGDFVSSGLAGRFTGTVDIDSGNLNIRDGKLDIRYSDPAERYLIYLENTSANPLGMALQAVTSKGNAITTWTEDGTALHVSCFEEGMAAYFFGDVLFEEGLVSFGKINYDGQVIQVDSSTAADPTAIIRNHGGTGVALRAWSEIGGTALEVYGKAELSGPTHITDTLDVVQESSGTVVSFSNTYDNDFDPNVKTLVVDGLNGITLSSTAGLDGTAGYFSSGDVALHIDNGNIQVGSDIGLTTSVTISGTTLNFTKGLLTSVT